MYKRVAAEYIRAESRGLIFVGILFFLALAAPSLGTVIDPYLPTWFWLDVRSVHVADTVAGEDPIMTVDRTIRRDFRGDYTVIIKRKRPHGFVFYCAGSGSSDYNTDAALPDPLKLSWWLYPARCDLTAGSYRVDTLWRIDTKSGNVREVRKRSNVFEVKAR